MQKQAHVFSVQCKDGKIVFIDYKPQLKLALGMSEAQAARSMRAQGYSVKLGATLTQKAFDRLYPGVYI